MQVWSPISLSQDIEHRLYVFFLSFQGNCQYTFFIYNTATNTLVVVLYDNVQLLIKFLNFVFKITMYEQNTNLSF